MVRKDKTTAALLSLFLGYMGVHRFYLRQNGLGFLYFMLMFVGIGFFLGILDFFRFLFMEEEVFDMKYNRSSSADNQYRDTDFDRRRYGRRRAAEPKVRTSSARVERRPRATYAAKVTRSNPYQRSGIEKYRNFDYYGAINDFVKALDSDGKNVPVHFNLACAYSLTEQEDQAFFHLGKAVELGFKDFEKIRNHDALAYIRIQKEFETFAKNGYRILKPNEKPKEEVITANPDLLEQLRQLGELRERNLLTEEEFILQKKKLLG